MFNFDSVPSLYFSQLNYDATISLALPAWCASNSDLPTCSQVYQAMRELEFQGASDLVKFDDVGTRSNLGLSFKVMNIVVKQPPGATGSPSPINRQVLSILL
jgi:hypothetical protein